MASLELYLVRHGVAAERGPAYPDDTKRPLTAKGIAAMRREVKALNVLDVSVDLIISSPLVRTRQTAEILADGLSGKPPVVFSDALAPEGTSGEVVQEVAKHSKHKRIALVGHEPNIGELAARLIDARTAFEFKKGGVCRIDFETFPQETGQLRWLLTPRILKNVG